MGQKKKQTPPLTKPGKTTKKNYIKTPSIAPQKGFGVIEDIQNQQTNITDYYANFFATK